MRGDVLAARPHESVRQPSRARRHESRPATQPGVGVRSLPLSGARRRTVAARREARRSELRQLAVVVLISVAGSFLVAVVAPLLLPQKPATVMAEPLFDTEAFYRAHPGVISGTFNPAAGLARAHQAKLKPVAGLSQAQMDNAFIIAEVGRQMQLPSRADAVAIATALQETNLRNLANPSVPESLKYPHESTGNNFDSIGLFQQRPSMGWGAVSQLMDPVQASARFYTRLAATKGWADMSIGSAAQAVQRSAFPDAYANHSDRAKKIIDGMG